MQSTTTTSARAKTPAPKTAFPKALLNTLVNTLVNTLLNTLPNKNILLFTTAILLSSTTTFAQTATNNETTKGFTANTHLEVQHDDNIRRTGSFEQSDTLVILKPELQWLTLFGKHQLDASYKGDYGFYSDEDDLNFDDHAVKLHGLFDHSRRISTDIVLGYKQDHDDPGSTNAQTINAGEFNRFTDKHAKGTLFYGKKQSKGQLALRINHNELSYDNNQQGYRDHDRDTITATFYYRIAPKTRLLFETAYTEYDYESLSNFSDGTSANSSFNQSNDDTRYLLGVEWQGTAKTTGIFKIGQQDKEYDSTLYNDISGLTLSLDMIWKPNTYTTVKVGASRDTDESAQAFTSGFVSEYIHADYSHLLTPRTKITANIGYGDEEYAYAISRNDKRKELDLGIEHELRRWLVLGAKLQYESRDSSEERFDYTGKAVMVHITAAVD